MKEKIKNVILKSNKNGNYLVEEDSNEIVVDGRREYCSSCGHIIKPANDWDIICYLMNVIQQLKEKTKEIKLG